VIIIGPRRKHHIGVPQADGANDLFAYFKRRFQLAIVVFELSFAKNASAAISLCGNAFIAVM